MTRAIVGRTMRVLASAVSGSIFALAALMLSECTTAAPTCVPGESVACATADCTGYQVCASDGKSYDPCACGSHAFFSTGPSSGLLGAQCQSTADCRKGFDCISVDSKLINGEGPSGGMCLAQCLPAHDFCTSVDATAKCIVLFDGGTPDNTADDVSYCLPGCSLGTQPNELDKCRRRVDLVCSEAIAGSKQGYCRPSCRSDLDCGTRFCDLKTGLCSDSKAQGDPIGSACDVSASTCAGGCIQHGGTYAECSGVCSYGTPGCGQPKTGAPLDSFCYLDPSTTSGNGDLGYCARLCDCDKDCGRPDAVCEPRPSLSATTGRAGVCGSSTYSTGQRRPNTPC